MEIIIIEKSFGKIELSFSNICGDSVNFQLEYNGIISNLRIQDLKYYSNKNVYGFTIHKREKTWEPIAKIAGLVKGDIIITITESQFQKLQEIAKIELEKEKEKHFAELAKAGLIAEELFKNATTIKLRIFSIAGRTEAQFIATDRLQMEYLNKKYNVIIEFAKNNKSNIDDNAKSKSNNWLDYGFDDEYEVGKDWIIEQSEKYKVEIEEKAKQPRKKEPERELSAYEQDCIAKGMQQCWECGGYFYPKKDDYDAGMPYCGC